MVGMIRFIQFKNEILIKTIALLTLITISCCKNFADDFIDIGIRLNGDLTDSMIADLIATENELDNSGYIHGIDMYHFRINRQKYRRSNRLLNELIEELNRDARIKVVTVAERLQRAKRNIPLLDMIKYFQRTSKIKKEFSEIQELTDMLPSFKMNFTDLLYSKQWYLENIGQLNTPVDHDINVVPVWKAGFTGANITICIIDDGIEHKHPELIANYVETEYSFDLNDLNDENHDPTPVINNSDNSHGTQCASAAMGAANNEFCGVGVAYNANIAGVRLLDGIVTSLLEARALAMFENDIDIKSASWGPYDDGTRMETPTHLINMALDHAVTYGRRGKGVIFVWASGNGGHEGDDCGADGYVSHQNIISIGAINHEGKSTFFGEACPSMMAVVYSGGIHSGSHSDKMAQAGVVAADLDGKCTTSFFGTSAAAPLAAGSFALVLEANPELTYRDVMHIIAETARIPTISEIDGWFINGAGYHVNDKFGFGVLDIARMVNLAQNWNFVQPRYQCYQEYSDGKLEWSIGETVEAEMYIDQCENITRLEHVVANISYNYYRRGDIKIILISPSGTPSEMLSFRDNDVTDQGIQYFPFLSVHNWGESPVGRWKLRIESRERHIYPSKQSKLKNFNGELNHFALRFYGSYKVEDIKANQFEKRDHIKKGFYPNQEELRSIYQHELKLKKNSPIKTNSKKY